MVQVFAQNFLATGGFGGGEDGGVPVGGLKAVFEGQGGLENCDGVILDAETEPLLDQANGDVMWQGVGAARAGGLDLEGVLKLPPECHPERSSVRAKAGRNAVEGPRGISGDVAGNSTGSFDCATPAFPPPLRSG